MILFFRPEDMGVRKFQAAGGKLEVRQIEQVLELIRKEDGPADPEKLPDQTDLRDKR